MNIPNVPDELLNKIKNRECAAFVGSGLSTLAGLPSWKELIVQLIERHYVSEVDKKSRQALLDMAESGRLIDLAEFIRSSLRPRTFRDTFVKMLDPSDIQPTEAYLTLASIPFSAVVTTNYDHLLEDTYSRVYGSRYARAYPYTNISALGNLLAEKQFFILKAHGTVDDLDNIIFSRTDYQRVMYGSPAYRTFFTSLFASRTFLFIGYSLSDPDLIMVLENLASIFGGYCPIHYVLLSDTGEIDRKLFEQQFNVEVIPCVPSPEGYPDVHGFLKAIVARREGEKMKREAQEKQVEATRRLASIGEMAAGIAHELNSPLANVIGYSELLLSREIPQDVQTDIEVIQRNAQRAITIVRSLLAFARSSEPQKQHLIINDLIQRVLEMRSYELKVSNITVVTELADKLPGVLADPQQLEQVFLNIILNAEQAMLEVHNQGCVTIRTEVMGGMVRVVLSDDGPGIPAENLWRVFNPFFTTKAPGKGTGLGLSICHGIVTAHSGRIYAESKVGEGATFFVEFPVAEAEGGAP